MSVWCTLTWVSSGADETDEDDELQQSETSVGTELSQHQSPERAHHGASCAFVTPPHRPSDGATADIATGETNGFTGSAASKGSIATPTTMPAGGERRGSSPNLSTLERECGDEGRSGASIDVTEPTTAKGNTRRGKKESGAPSAGGRRVGGGMGSKWSLKVLRRRLAGMGVDVPALWQDIHSVVIKTLIAIEAQVQLYLCVCYNSTNPGLIDYDLAEFAPWMRLTVT